MALLSLFMLIALYFESASAESPIVLSEVMFNPSGNESLNEYVEIFNTSNIDAVDIEGWTVGDSLRDDEIVETDEGTVLEPRQFGLILDSSYLSDESRVYDPLPEDALILSIDGRAFGSRGLSNSKGTVILKGRDGAVVASYTYTSENRDGHSDEKIDLEGEDSSDNWRDSRISGGTPGATNSVDMDFIVEIVRPDQVVINEIMFDPPDGQSEWVELFNRSDEGADLLLWTLADERSNSDLIISEETHIVPPGGYVVVYESKAIFEKMGGIVALSPPGRWPSLNNDGDSVVIRDPRGVTIDSLSYDGERGVDGISLERIDPDGGSLDPFNWFPSASDDGSTPGEDNSVFAESLPSEVDIEVSPNPFVATTTISYTIPSSATQVSLWIYDSQGRRVRKVLNARPSGSSRSVVWDGRDADGVRLKMGIYVIYLEAIDALRGVVHRGKKAVALASKL